MQPINYDLNSIKRLLRTAIDSNIVPCAVSRVTVNGETVLDFAFGHSSLEPIKSVVSHDHLFDIASITKSFTATAIMILVEKGKIHLDQAVSSLLPEFIGTGKHSVTIRQLLTHSSGLPARTSISKLAKTRDMVIDMTLQTPLVASAGSREIYTDLGFILLGEIVSRTSDTMLDKFIGEQILAPLEMNATFFNPHKDKVEQCAATELIASRGGVIQGEVHDPKTFLMGGISGHAGLFSTVSDLTKYCQFFLRKNKTALPCVLSASSLQMMINNHTSHLSVRRGLGWSLDPCSGFGFDQGAGPSVFGHTGFTGTSIYVDPTLNYTVVLLTNRIHPSRNNKAYFVFREKYHSAVRLLIQ